MRVLILGCGYLGLPLGAELARQGHEVHGVRRSPGTESELEAAGIRPWVADVGCADDLSRLPTNWDWIVNCLSSSRGGVDEYRKVYLNGTRNLLEWLGDNPIKKYVFTSSTSVYGQTDGSVVTEESPTNPDSPTSRVLLETEALLQRAFQSRSFPSIILRLAGIYGPGRGHLFHQYLRGEARLHDDGRRFINMIHLQDAIRAVIAALENGQPGEIYNVADDMPVIQKDFFEWLSIQLGRPMPPYAPSTELKGRKRGLTNKQVSNQKLRTILGLKLLFPTYKEGYSAEIQRLRDSGELKN